VVLIGLGGPRGDRVGLTVRADIPPPGLEAEAAATLMWSVRTGGPEAVVVVLVSEAPDDSGANGAGADLPHRALLCELTPALSRAGIAVRDSLLVRAGRWWSYECPDGCCRPGAGTPLPGGVPELEAAAVAGGMVVADSREALERRIAPDPGRGATADACVRLASRRDAPGDPEKPCGDWAAVADAVRLCAPGASTTATRLSDDLVARVLGALQDPAVRDRALTLSLGEAAPAAETLWTECTRRAPEPLGAPPATLLAVSAWLRGDGAMANIALARALDSDPGYRLATLLLPALAACLPPAGLRALIAASTGARPAN
jgi:hypothetical protein